MSFSFPTVVCVSVDPVAFWITCLVSVYLYGFYDVRTWDRDEGYRRSDNAEDIFKRVTGFVFYPFYLTFFLLAKLLGHKWE